MTPGETKRRAAVPDGRPLPAGPPDDPIPEAEEHFLDRLRGGDVEAGHRFVRGFYPAVYRYLLFLTGHRETAEDLTQETFLQAWRRLDQFEGRAPLRLWLHQIARREFLQAKRRPRISISLEDVADLPEPLANDWTGGVDMRVLLGRLPEEQREVMLLSYLGGYSSSEIAQILQAPASTVRYRLGAARAHLAKELGEGDLAYLNEPTVPMRQWAWLPLDQMHALAVRLRVKGEGCRVSGVRSSKDRHVVELPTESAPVAPDTRHPSPFTRSGASEEETVERREFLRNAAAGAVGLMLPEAEKEVVDGRLAQKTTCAFKGAALSDVCGSLQAETGVHVVAGPSVADEKVTLFCEKMPLRQIMRQLSRPFGYTWLRTRSGFGVRGSAFGKDPADPNPERRTPNAEYRYELVQDLRSQLLEEELRNRDRNTALLALEQEIQRYRPFLDLSPDEALARAKTAPPDEKKLLERLATNGWGQIQMYFRLSPQQQAALLAGEELTFSQEQKFSGDQPMPEELGRGVLQSQRGRRILVSDGMFHLESAEKKPDGMRLEAVPEARAAFTLRLQQSEVGQFTLRGLPGVFISKDSPMKGDFYLFDDCPILATGTSPAAGPDNATNAKLARDPALQRRVAVAPGARCEARGARPADTETSEVADPPRSSASRLAPGASKLTSADVLEALHRATGMPIVADFYTRLYAPEAVTMAEMPLFEALNRLSEAMGLRWHKDAGSLRSEGAWLQFRSASYFNDRPMEVPNRLLTRWSAARRQHGMLRLDDLIEIAGLPDAQLNGSEMAEGAKEIWGLAEWDLARKENLRPHMRFLAELTAEQRQMASGPSGLPFTKMSLAQQQKFLSFLLMPDTRQLPSQTTLSACVLRVAYTHPGGFQWKQPGPHWFFPSPIREGTRDAALRAALRIDPQAAEEQIEPTRLEVIFLYLPGDSKEVLLRFVCTHSDVWT